MKSIYSKEDNSMHEQPELTKPDFNSSKMWSGIKETEVYVNHIRSLRTIPCTTDHNFQDQKIYEEGKDYEIVKTFAEQRQDEGQTTTVSTYAKLIAIPVEQPIPADILHNYVCGFLFDVNINRVILIWKEKPAWQKGKLNGVGGKIENGETPIQAMRREFKEETGIAKKNWMSLISLSGDDWVCHFFYAIDSDDEFEYAETMEREEIAKIEIEELYQYDHILNLSWLIPMAAYKLKFPEEFQESSKLTDQGGLDDPDYSDKQGLKEALLIIDEKNRVIKQMVEQHKRQTEVVAYNAQVAIDAQADNVELRKEIERLKGLIEKETKYYFHELTYPSQGVTKTEELWQEWKIKNKLYDRHQC